ncbi:helix-turn-helix domain-containing protein [Paenibacillus sp. An7]|uniref:helix-turn-helix domain-containing protein n=1 Tax=Paenibacillus sp. An7 TaxID=2689577 RepID=UPI00135955CA|nr:helix-turn-helix domain-containing protein [Paenibacillus sp. An7]
MEEKDVSAVITDSEFLKLLQEAKQGEPEAMLKIIDLYQEDIEKISKAIRIPKEDAVSHIITELIEYIQNENNDWNRGPGG